MTRTAPLESVTWEFFLAEFKKQYVGHIYLSNMRRDFHNLKQRYMSVTKYQREITRLSKYALEMLVTEEEKCRKFEVDLNDYIRAHVIGFGHEDFSKIVTCELNVERVKMKSMIEKKEIRVRKTLLSQVLISTRIRNLEDHRVLISLKLKDQLRLSVARLFYRHH